MLRGRWSLGAVLVAACMLVLQPGLGSSLLSFGQHSVQADAFGNPLCITGANHAAPGTGGSHAKPAGCCILGCSMFSQAVRAPPDQALVSVVFTTGFYAARPGLRNETHFTRDYEPGNPRAPPFVG